MTETTKISYLSIKTDASIKLIYDESDQNFDNTRND